MIIQDKRDIVYIGGTRIKVAQIVIESTRFGYTNEEIQEAHGHLSLNDIQEALAYYANNRAKIEAEIEAEIRFVEEMRASISQQPTRAQLDERRTAINRSA